MTKSKIEKRQADYANSYCKDLNFACEEFLDKSSPNVTLSELLGFDVHGKKCIYCETDVNSKNVDELIPITKGGRYSFHNFVMCCGRCNSSKSDKDIERWL